MNNPQDDRGVKAALRVQLRTLLATLTPAEVAARSTVICTRLLQSEPIARARCILAYAALGTEVDLGVLISAALDGGQRVSLPRIDWTARTMVPAAITDWPHGLAVTRHGLREPPEHAPVVDAGAVDVVLVPGLGFDADGGRLGRGAGFYDRFLSQPGLTALVVGVAFDLQIVDQVPMRRDLPSVAPDAYVDEVYTELRMFVRRSR